MPARYGRRFELEVIGPVTVARIYDPSIVSEQDVKAIGDQLFQLVDEDGQRNLVVNFANVRFLSSHMLGKLVTLTKKILNAGGRLALCHLAPPIMDAFTASNLKKLFNIYATEDEALHSFET